MNKKYLKMMTALVSVPLCLSVTQAYANQVDFALEKPGWSFNVIPYAWLLNMNGRVGAGPLTTHIDQDFSDVLQKLNFAGMLAVEANRDRFGMFANALYADLGDDVSDGPFTADATNHFGLISGGISYRVFEHCFGSSYNGRPHKLAIEPYGGFRYTLNDTKVKVSGFGLSASASKNENWVDPILGARILLSVSNAWSLTVAGDVGGTNHSNDYSYNAMGLVGYSPQTFWTNTTAYVGYRVLYQHYNTGSGADRFDWNMKLFGPMLGFSISF